MTELCNESRSQKREIKELICKISLKRESNTSSVKAFIQQVINSTK